MKKKSELIIMAVTCALLTIAIIVQIKSVNKNGTTVNSNQRVSNLKTQVLKMKEKYDNQYEELEIKTRELEKTRETATKNDSELEQIENEIKKENILAGNTDVTGPGVIITLKDGKADANYLDPENVMIHAENVLAIINELKNAGAEAISVNGQRIVNTTAIPCDGNVIIVNGKKISTPIEVSAIGLTEALATLKRPGGTLEHFALFGKEVDFKKVSNLKIPKYTGVISFKYAKTEK